MKTKEQIKPNYSPVYAAALYPDLCRIFQENRYALAVHGSLARDFDLIAVPWAEEVSDADALIAHICSVYTIYVVGDPEERNHGRIAYTISVGFGECAIDLSFMPNS